MSATWPSRCHINFSLQFEAYDSDKMVLNLKHNYLSKQKQQTKINSSYTDRNDIVNGARQGSIIISILKGHWWIGTLHRINVPLQRSKHVALKKIYDDKLTN